MPKPASKIARVTLVCLCLLGLGFGLWRCVKSARTAAQNKPLVIPSFATRLTMANEGTCDWMITVKPVDGSEGDQWKVPTGKSAEVVLVAGDYQVEQKMLALDFGAAPVRRFQMKLEAKQNYRWRLVNLLSSDAKELNGLHDAEGRR